MSIDAFTQSFAQLEDPRQSAKITYPLFDVLFLAVCATIAGAEGWEDIYDFGEAHLDWLQGKGLFKEGLPVDDTIARILSRLDPSQFQKCFIRWMKSVSAQTEGQLVAIDGKVLRSSYNRQDRLSTIHMVSAFATENSLVLGQLKTDDKSNEIEAIPALLQLLELKGCLVSIDAIGCQTEIATTLVKQGADYLLALKGNQETLAKAVRKAFEDRLNPEAIAQQLSIEKGHGRMEARHYQVMPADELASRFPQWEGLRSIGVAVGYRREASGRDSLEYRYYISSADLDEQRFASAVRHHWGIENRLHWVLDVTMGEDDCPIYRGNGAEILACLRHIALNMLRSEKTKKASIRRKQNIAGMNSAYLDKVLLAGINGMVKE